MRPARPLPASVMREEVMPKVSEMERGLEAFLTGDRRLLLLDILAERKTTSYDHAKTLLETVLAMPGYEEVAATTGNRSGIRTVVGPVWPSETPEVSRGRAGTNSSLSQPLQFRFEEPGLVADECGSEHPCPIRTVFL